MENIIDRTPSDVQYVENAPVFYFGVQANRVGTLPGKAEFQVVYAPREGRGWEYAHYRVFDKQNGIEVVEDRPLRPEEQAYFEAWVDRTKEDTGTMPAVKPRKPAVNDSINGTVG